MPNWVIALIILFQPELRLLVEQIGRGRFIREAFRTAHTSDTVGVINEIVRAARRMSEKRIGALIAIEREVGLNDIVSTGRRIGGAVSSELLQTIFHPGTAMHDGGVVIQGQQMVAAMCLFPLSSRDDTPHSYGTRHRAAIGLSELTDAVIVVVSEETGRHLPRAGRPPDQQPVRRGLERAPAGAVAAGGIGYQPLVLAA